MIAPLSLTSYNVGAMLGAQGLRGGFHRWFPEPHRHHSGRHCVGSRGVGDSSSELGTVHLRLQGSYRTSRSLADTAGEVAQVVVRRRGQADAGRAEEEAVVIPGSGRGCLLLSLVLLPTQLLEEKTSILILIGIYTMVTVGLCLLMGYTGQVSLGQAAFFGTGAYLSAILSTTYDVNPWLAMLVAAIATGIFACLISYPIFRLRGNYLAMATLGLGMIIWILFRELNQYTGGPDGMSGIPYLSIGGFVFRLQHFQSGISSFGSSAGRPAYVPEYCQIPNRPSA